MTYEEKLNLIIQAIDEARKMARKGHSPKLYQTSDNKLIKVQSREIYDILLQLQDDENIITIEKYPTALKPTLEQTSEMLEEIDYFQINLLDGFNQWSEVQLLKLKGNLSSLDFINILKILDVVLDINQQVQIADSTTVFIPALPQMVRFSLLFPGDSVGSRQTYQGYRWEGLKYLENNEIITAPRFHESAGFGYGEIEITVKSLASFDRLLREFTEEYNLRNKQGTVKKKSTQRSTAPTSSAEVSETKLLSYDPKTGKLDIQDKPVKLTKDSFRAKLLELILKDEKSKKKEWSWDEVIEEIEGITDTDELKEKKNKFYSACDGLTKFIAQKTGINDLLIFTKSTVQLNPKYL